MNWQENFPPLCSQKSHFAPFGPFDPLDQWPVTNIIIIITTGTVFMSALQCQYPWGPWHQTLLIIIFHFHTTYMTCSTFLLISYRNSVRPPFRTHQWRNICTERHDSFTCTADNKCNGTRSYFLVFHQVLKFVRLWTYKQISIFK